jgi:ABC-2 type transport system permease protein
VTAVPWDAPGRRGSRHLLDFYLTTARTAIAEQVQYRAANYAYMIGMVVEPVVYLVVWTTVAQTQGGAVGGVTAGDFVAYYIVWTLVRNMNIVFTPYGWEERIREGHLSALLLRPMHPLHFDLAYFAGWKVVVIVLWLPIAALLSLAFHPTFSLTWVRAGAFVVAIWGAYLIRSLVLWLLGMLTFWTTRVSALFELFFTLELLLSGRLVPLTLLPGWAQSIGAWTPFPSTFGFPIDTLAGNLDGDALARGLAVQLLWVLIGWVLVRLAWPRAVRRYAAVGG